MQRLVAMLQEEPLLRVIGGCFSRRYAKCTVIEALRTLDKASVAQTLKLVTCERT